MRDVPPGIQAKLDSGATTFCQCWRIDRNFGDPLGFTDHDVDIKFDGVVHEAATGFEASGVERSLGLSIDNAAARGVLKSDRITEQDIRGGGYDDARIRQWLVDWENPSDRMLMFRGDIGEIRRGELAFEVELRGLSERLNRPVGRNYLHICDAELGDGRCQFDTTAPGFSGLATLAEVEDSQTLRVTGLGEFAPGWFDDGALTWRDGVLAERTGEVRAHTRENGVTRLTLNVELPMTPSVGDQIDLTAGCDKRMETCKGKFANLVNFRGFPFMPGDGWSGAYPVEGGDYDGGSLE